MRETSLRGLFDGDPTAACLAGAGGTIHECNPAFARLFGFPDPGGARAGRIDTLLVDAAAWRRAAEGAAGGAAPPRFEIEARALDGRSLLLACDLAPADDPDLSGGVLAWFTDLTARRALERELMQVPKSPTGSRLVRSIGHDLGNMMMVVRGFSEVLARELPEGGKGRGWIAQIRTATDRATALGEELLATARPPDPRLEELSPAEVLSGCLPLLRRTAGTGVTVDPRAPAGERRILANRDQIEAMLLALVSMARAEMPAAGRLLVEIAEPGPGEAGTVLRVQGAEPGRAWEARLPTPAPPPPAP
jgi:two-component system cell cycle sensor histidine kinase/response regulator CckA